MAVIPLEVDNSQVLNPILQTADAMAELAQVTVDTNKIIAKSFAASGNAIDSTTDAIVDQSKTQEKLQDDVDALKKKITAFSKASKQAYDGKDPKKHKKAVDDAEESTDDLEDSTKKLGKTSTSVFGDMTEGIADVGDGFKDIGSAVATGDAGGIQGGLQGILGKLGPIGVGVGAVVGGAVLLGTKIAEIDQKFDGLRATVESLFQVTGDEADRIVTNVEAIAQTFDEDVNEVIIATNTLAKEFGLSGEEASNLLASGFNSAANAQGDLIDSVKEFSSQVRASGGEAGDLFAILERSNQEGIFSDKGIDVVKEFGLRIREQTDGTKDALEAAFGPEFSNRILKGVSDGSLTSIDALREVSNALGGLDESAASTQTLIADVFGGPGEDAGFRFLSLLGDINDEQGFQNRQLTEAQKRQQENLEANQRLASAQNELSKAIGDSSAIGRIWTDIQTAFIEALVSLVGFVNDLAEAFESLSNFQEFAIKQTLEFVEAVTFGAVAVNTTTIEWENLTDAEKENIQVKREAIKAIRNFGQETGQLVSSLEKQFEALQKGTLTDEARLRVVEELNQQYPEQIGNIDLLTASEEELLKVKQDIIKAEVEEDIARKKSFATQLINNQILIRQEELKNSQISNERRKVLEDEIAFLENQRDVRLELVEEEVRIQLGLIERTNDEIVEDEEETQDQRTDASGSGSKERLKIEADFQKAIAEILKRGEAARLADQFISEEERIKRQLEADRAELAALLEFAQDKNEILTGSRQLDQEVIDAFNLADEKLITDAQDKITAIYRQAAERQRNIRLQEAREILGIQQERFDTQIAFLEASEREELAIIEQQEKRRGEFTGPFERRIQLEKLDAQQFYLSERAKLIDQELALQLEALNNELTAIEDKEGAEIEAKRKSLEEKKKLLTQETDAQREELDLQLKNIQDNIDELEKIKGPTLGEVFGDIQTQLAESFGLTPEQLSSISAALQQVASQVFSTIQESLSEQIAASDELLAKLDEREQVVKDSLDREIAAANAGYAANVEAKRQELAEIEEAEIQAQRQKEELVKQQQLLDNIQQISSLVTASANLYSTLSPLPFGIGIALATLLTAGMFAAFAATKAKAKNVTSLGKGGSGDHTGVVTGKYHSQGGEPFLDHIEVERDEMWAVFNRKGSKKHGDMIHDFANAVNTDSLDKFMMDHNAPDVLIGKKNELKGAEIHLQSALISQDMRDNMAVLPDIKAALDKKFSEPERYIYQEGEDTILLEKWPNGSKRRTKLRKS